MSQRPSGIPLKKPLVNAQEMERHKEAYLKEKYKNSETNNLNDFSVQEEDEHLDTFEQLDSLLNNRFFLYF
jgi:hypothetical protein